MRNARRLGRAARRPELAGVLRVNSSRRVSVINRAAPSMVFSATLPVKPSVTTTSTLSEKISCPSTKPT